MLSLDECKSIFNKKHPELTITNAVDLDRIWYVFTALEDPNKPDDNDPFYKIDKFSGKIKAYSPIEDLDKYSEALYRQNRKNRR